MKTRVIMTVALAAVVGGIILLLGYGAESKKSSATKTGPVVITAGSPSSPSQTNQPAPLAEPVPEIGAAPTKLSPGLEEIVQLAQAGVGDDVLLAYVENSPTSYKLEVEEILYLRDLGVSAEVISALVRHGQVAPEPSPTLAATASEPKPPAENVNTNPPPAAEAAPPDANAYAITPPVEQVNYNYFYQTLAPYGSWIDVPAYGWCWQPTVSVVDVNWRPYCDRGRWLWSDCGWYWQSDYAWGWAPFHYGRWHCNPTYGWVWLPDTAWAPAWVTWRYSNAYCGWAPLPPGAYFDVGVGFRFHGGSVGVGFGFGLAPNCYTFVPTARFCDRTPWHHRLPPKQVVGIYNQTTIINNYTRGPDNRTMNLGPGQNAIAAVSRTEIRKVTLRDASPNGGTLIKSDRLDRDGKTLAVFRPQLPKQSSAPPPEITRRQQELRTRTDALVNSQVVQLARGDAESKTIAPATRGTARTASPEIRGSLVAPKPTDPAIGAQASRNGELRKSVAESGLNGSESTPKSTGPSAISRSPRSELRNAGTSSPTLVRPTRQELAVRPSVGVAPNSFESVRPDGNERSVAGQEPQSDSRPGVVAEELAQFRQQTQLADRPPIRQENRRFESGTGWLVTPPANRPAGQFITPPSMIQPQQSDRRFSSPEYRPPQSNFSPPANVAPTIRPSNPAPSQSPPPVVSPSQPAPASSPPASRPSTPSQSRGDSRKR